MTRTRQACASVPLAVMLAGCSGQGAAPDSGASRAPVETTITTPAEKGDPAPPAANGRIVGTERRFAPRRAPCHGCAGTSWWIGYDPDTGRALRTYYDLTIDNGWNPLAGIAVVGPDRELVTLSCADDLACPRHGDPWRSAAALGPGADEITLRSAGHKLQVIGYDGTVRRTIDLSAGLVRGERVESVAWSPDRSRLAVKGSNFPGSNNMRVVVFDRLGGVPSLVRTTTRWGAIPHVLGLAWSPDGSRIGFVETFEFSGGTTDLVSVRVPEAGQSGPGAATMLYSWKSHWEDSWEFAWSPDGTRVAVGAPHGVLELSADDGSVLARHRLIRGPLVWLPAQP